MTRFLKLIMSERLFPPHPLDGRTLVILGDSYSTYQGYNPEGYEVYYPNDGIMDVDSVKKTWWHRLITKHHMQLLKNDSWSGSTVSTSVRKEHPAEASFLVRMRDTLDGEDKPEVIILFGGTNDSWMNNPVGQNQYADWTEEEDGMTLPAFGHLFRFAKEQNPDALVICVVNTELLPEIEAGLEEACAHEKIVCVKLRDIEKKWGHPTAAGMKAIAEQISEALK